MNISHLEINLPQKLTEQQRSLILRYFSAGHRFSPEERFAALRGFDLLREAIVISNRRRQSFSVIYDTLIDERYANDFIDTLLNAENVASAAAKRRFEIGREIRSILRKNGYYTPAVPDSRFLAAFCLYWWYSFSKGYAFEIEVFRDLHISGISFTGHNLRDKRQRFSKIDLTIQEQTGDIKTSTYFLHIERTRGLAADFYITQVFDSQGSRRRVVILHQAAWEEIDGKTEACQLDNLSETLPEPGHFEHLGKRLVIVDYSLWKQKAKKQQDGGK